MICFLTRRMSVTYKIWHNDLDAKFFCSSSEKYCALSENSFAIKTFFKLFVEIIKFASYLSDYVFFETFRRV